MILACFIYKKVLKSFSDLADCYDHYMYNHMDAGQIHEFELYNVTAKQGMMYERIFEYSELQLSAKRDLLYTINSRNPKRIAKQAFVYKVVLDGFTI